MNNLKNTLNTLKLELIPNVYEAICKHNAVVTVMAISISIIAAGIYKIVKITQERAVSLIKSNMLKIQKENNELQSRIQNLESSLSEHSKCNKYLDGVKSTLTIYEGRIVDLQSNVKSLTEEKTKLESRLLELESNLSGKGERIKGLESNLSKETKEKKELESEVLNLNSIIEETRDNILRLSSSREGQEDKIKYLNNELSKRKESITSLENNIKSLEGKIASMNLIKPQMEEAQDKLQKTIHELDISKGEVEALKLEISRLNYEMNCDIDSILKDINIEDSVEEFEVNAINELKIQLSNKEEEIKKLNKKVEELEERLAKDKFTDSISLQSSSKSS